MRKEKFYTLLREVKGRPYFAPREGYSVPNDFDLALFVYQSDAGWFVVEGSSGLALTRAQKTRKAAIAEAMKRCEKDLDVIRNIVVKSIEKIGSTPLHKAYYL